MRFKRRKPRVVWLPVHGTDFGPSPDDNNFANGLGTELSVPADGALYTSIDPVTFDYSDSASNEEGSEQRSLQDLTSGNSYRLRRIVGKFFGAANFEPNALVEIPTIDVAAGFMVNRTDDSGNILEVTSSGDTTQRGPLAQDSAQDPWIWRRRWLLTAYPPSATDNVVNVSASLGGQGQWPNTTGGYGSVADGPHIDQKTARVISNQERLFFWIQARVTNPGATTNNGLLNWSLDVRLLASLRTNSGNRRNASR